jgi:DNA primase
MPSIDFTELRATISMSSVLDLLGFVPSERSGDQLRGPCPLHGSTSPNSRSFSVNPRKNSFRCFRCGAAGNQLELWAAAQKLPIYDAALDLCQRLGVAVPERVRGRSSPRPEKRNP